MSLNDIAPAPAPATPTTLRQQVQARYAATATAVLAGQSGCCSSGCCGDDSAQGSGCCDDGCCGEEGFGAGLYEATDRAALPQAAVDASLGCGNPLAVADLQPGETVLDLGSGGGIDVLLSARRVGPAGKAYGLDMTPEMLQLARRNAAEAGIVNAEFLAGHIEDIPLPDASVDVVISNCVINLSTDKPAVFASIHRVLRPGGRLGVSDVIADDHLTPDQRSERGNWVGCIAGALSTAEYTHQLTHAGFVDIHVIPTHQVADGMHSAIIRARKDSL